MQIPVPEKNFPVLGPGYGKKISGTGFRKKFLRKQGVVTEKKFPERGIGYGKFFSGMGISGKTTPIGIFFEIYIKFWIFIKKSGILDSLYRNSKIIISKK